MNTEYKFNLSELGITHNTNIFRNLPVERLIEETLLNEEGLMGMKGAIMVDTGTYTGRSPNDKFFVDEPSSSDNLWWGPVNQKVGEDVFNELYEKVTGYYNTHSNSKTYVRPNSLFTNRAAGPPASHAHAKGRVASR